ncbi:hypothetical protein [Pseudoxanthomonas sp. CF385]|uniref:hypothetical protein n=1 Tax=Pseudoxanthomonas sp. CF385 TaxID=1881042 RepID=UPI000A852E62|nr:hypothetical protein [Pseudoxanthomonas sp. CF385]
MSAPCPGCEQARRLSALLADDDVDAALDAGLMAWTPCPDHAAAQAGPIVDAQSRLRTAWAARERYRQRTMRLARRAAEREARRIAAQPRGPSAPVRPALPAAAAAILERARAKAAERTKP